MHTTACRLSRLDAWRRRICAALDAVIAAEPPAGDPEYDAWYAEVGRITAWRERIEARIVAAPAAGMADLAVKLRVAARDLPPVPWDDECTAMAALRAALADAERLTGHNRSDSC